MQHSSPGLVFHYCAILRQASNIDDVLSHHTSFLDNCLKDCMLTNPELLKIFSKLMSVCVMFTNCMQVCTASPYWPCHCQLLWVPDSYDSPFFQLNPSCPRCTWKSLCSSCQQDLELDCSDPHPFSQIVSVAFPSTKFFTLFIFGVGISLIWTELPLFSQSCSRIWGVSGKAL